jgi:hypothetical protein
MLPKNQKIGKKISLVGRYFSEQVFRTCLNYEQAPKKKKKTKLFPGNLAILKN